MSENLTKVSFLNQQNDFNFHRSGTVTPTFLTKTTPGVIKEKLLFFQRVFDSEKGWCYFLTENSPNSTPDSSDTNPNHTNQIVSYQIISITTKALKG
jgi:hypothetical protein